MTRWINMKTMEAKLRKAGRKHARLYLFCNFMALLIISAYSALIFSRTVQVVFPKGGDSRKQMYAIFLMTLTGCVVFTVYAAGLFFRHKSRELGILMAMGASRKRLLPGLFREVVLLSSVSAAAGIAAGFPFVWALWGMFRLVLVDSSQMKLVLDFRCLFLSAAFFILVVGFACLTAWRYVNKTNIMEVIREEHINEPVKEPGRWCGPVGLALIFAGGALAYYAPQLWEHFFSSYSPSWLNVLYISVLTGLYLVILHTVVYGWGQRTNHFYKNRIARGMLKFQAKQTVSNLLVITLLVAGACFAIFYIPVNSTSSMLSYAEYSYDYCYQYRADQKIPDRKAVMELAEEYRLTLKDWTQGEYITLGAGGWTKVLDKGNQFHREYRDVLKEIKILSEDTFYALTGQKADVKPGTYYAVNDRQETNVYLNNGAKDLTNMVTRKHLDTRFAGYLHYGLLSDQTGYFVLDSQDYSALAEGLTDDWKGQIVQFNADGEDSYAFADRLYHTFVASFDESCEYIYAYDRVAKIVANEKGESYWMDETDAYDITYDQADSLAFRQEWTYRPSFRILLINDYLRTMGVLYMMFLFIFIVCLTTAFVICYTRCQTIALNNRYIFEDLHKLGASAAFLSKELRKQCSYVFRTPFVVGTSVMFLLFSGILYANDGKIVDSEWMALGVCMGILATVVIAACGVYCGTVATIRRQLGIR